MAKELLFGVLALVSVGLLVWDYFWNPTDVQHTQIIRLDVVIALLFLADYLYLLHKADHKKEYVLRNWHLLLASIPIVDSWAEALKALRLLELVRLLRAGEHVLIAEKTIRTQK